MNFKHELSLSKPLLRSTQSLILGIQYQILTGATNTIFGLLGMLLLLLLLVSLLLLSVMFLPDLKVAKS